MPEPSPPTSSPDPAAPSTHRDRGLDLLRAAALVRVVVWHATGAAAVTVLAAMPVMFFVSGSLFAASASRRGAWRTVRDRLRRIGPSLWLFAAVAWGAMAVAAAVTGAELGAARAVWWVVPVTDPAGTAWEAGWLSSPLWYLRTLLWIMAGAPLLGWLVRRAPAVLFAGWALAVVALEALDRGAGWAPSIAPRAVWQVGDVVLYGGFFAFGMWTRGASRTIAARTWGMAAGATGVVAALVWAVYPPPGGVVNDSHVVHLVVGATLLFAVLAAAGPIGRLAERRWIRPGVDLLGRRSLTIYLWHTTAIALALVVLGRLGVDATGDGAVAYAVAIVGGTAVLVALTGWVEDLAARRPARLWPVAVPRWPAPARARAVHVAGAVALAAVVLLAAVGLPWAGHLARGGEAVAFRPRVPSQAPPPPSVVVALDPSPAWWSNPATIDPDALEGVLTAWTRENDIAGAGVAVSVPEGGSWVGVTGVTDSGAPRTASTQVDSMSVTKLFTANLVYRAIELGLIDLDDPIPPLAGLPDLPLAGRVTVRQLLSHRSGLVNYRDTAAFQADPTVVQGPADAVALSVADGVAEPGTQAVYSSTNYLILGYLLEQLVGRPFDELLASSLLEPIGLEHTVHLAPEPGEPRFSTAGIVADVEDLARAGEELLVNHVGISDEAWREMSAVDQEAGLGAGTMQYCPCTERDGELEAFAVGYAGGHTILALLPQYGVVVALDITGDFYGEQDHFAAVEPLMRSLADLLREVPPSQETASVAPA